MWKHHLFKQLPPDHSKPEAQQEVLWEDQERINTFSKLNNRITNLKEELKKQQEEQEYISDVQMELELVDEDEFVQ